MVQNQSVEEVQETLTSVNASHVVGRAPTESQAKKPPPKRSASKDSLIAQVVDGVRNLLSRQTMEPDDFADRNNEHGDYEEIKKAQPISTRD